MAKIDVNIRKSKYISSQRGRGMRRSTHKKIQEAEQKQKLNDRDDNPTRLFASRA